MACIAWINVSVLPPKLKLIFFQTESHPYTITLSNRETRSSLQQTTGNRMHVSPRVHFSKATRSFRRFISPALTHPTTCGFVRSQTPERKITALTGILPYRRCPMQPVSTHRKGLGLIVQTPGIRLLICASYLHLLLLNPMIMMLFNNANT
jgi:hypothetical protein